MVIPHGLLRGLRLPDETIPHRLGGFVRMTWLLQEIDAFDQRWPFASDVGAVAAGMDNLQLRLPAFQRFGAAPIVLIFSWMKTGCGSRRRPA
ncbi:MAG: hypothetical protein ABSF60_06220 [Verrucomicrobiota bacterium]